MFNDIIPILGMNYCCRDSQDVGLQPNWTPMLPPSEVNQRIMRPLLSAPQRRSVIDVRFSLTTYMPTYDLDG